MPCVSKTSKHYLNSVSRPKFLSHAPPLTFYVKKNKKLFFKAHSTNSEKETSMAHNVDK